MYKKMGQEIADSLVGVLWEKDLLDRVRAIVAETRKKRGAKQE